MIVIAAVASLKAASAAEQALSSAGSVDQAPAPAAAPEPSGAGAPSETPTAEAKSPAGQCPAPSFADQAGLSQSEVQVLQALGERRKALDARAAEIETKADVLGAAEKRVEARLAELKKLEAQVQAMLGTLDAQEQQRIDGLVNVYQRMKPKEAATIFDGLDDETLTKVASRMKQQNLAEIMGKMSPERARKLTRALANLRDAAPPSPTTPQRPGATPARAPA
jgi:flagellar motility protein MotE (MotC chaperone)